MDSTSEGENNDFNFGRNFEFSAGPSGGNVQQVDNWPGAQGRSWGGGRFVIVSVQIGHEMRKEHEEKGLVAEPREGLH